MARIRTIPPSQAEGELKAAYERLSPLFPPEYARPEVASDGRKLQSLLVERGSLESTAELVRRLDACLARRAEDERLLADAGSDPDLKELAREDLETLAAEETALDEEIKAALITEPEDLRRLLLVPVRPLQSLHDRHLLDLGEGSMWRNDELGRTAAFFANRLGQIADTDLGTFRDQYGSFDGVLEFSHIARPAVPDEEVVHARRQRLHILLVTVAELVEEVVAEQRNVFRALAERRHA